MAYILSTERLGLRTWTDADLVPFAEINLDPDVMRYFPKTLTVDETREMIDRINLHFDKNGYGLFALEKLSTNTFIGFAGLMAPSFVSSFPPCVEIGWRIKKEEWNKGYATEAAKACLQYGFETLKLARIYSFTSKMNVRSERVMQKIGMIKEGEFDHPNIAVNNVLRRHLLYKIEKKDYFNEQ